MTAWIARMGAVTVAQIERRYRVGRTIAYRLSKRLTDAGLVTRVETLRKDPSLLVATRIGIRYAGLSLPPAGQRR